MYELYYLTGNDYSSYNLVQIYANGTYQVRTAEENNALDMFSDTHGLMYYYFKAITYLAIMDYSVISGHDIRGYLYNDTNSADLLYLFTLVNFGPYGPPGPDRVYPELVRFNFSTTNDSIPEVNCHFTDPMGQYSTLKITTLHELHNHDSVAGADERIHQECAHQRHRHSHHAANFGVFLAHESKVQRRRGSRGIRARLHQVLPNPEHDDSSALVEHDINYLACMYT